MNTKLWTVKTVGGAAGGPSRAAKVTLEITTESDTVEQVRCAVEALPELLAAAHELLDVTVPLGQSSETVKAMIRARAAIVKAEVEA